MIRQARRFACAHARGRRVPAVAPALAVAAGVVLWAVAKFAEHAGLARGMVLAQLALLLGMHELLQLCCVPLGVRSATRAAAVRFVRRRLARRSPAAVDLATKQPEVCSEAESDTQQMDEPTGVSSSNRVTTPALVTVTADKASTDDNSAVRLATAEDIFISDDKAATAGSSACRYCESVDMTASESSGDEADDEQTDEAPMQATEPVRRAGSGAKLPRERHEAWLATHVQYVRESVKVAAAGSGEVNLRASQKTTLSAELLSTLEPPVHDEAVTRAKDAATPCTGVKEAIKAFEAHSLDSFRAGVDAEHTFTSSMLTKLKPDAPAVSVPEKTVATTVSDTQADTRMLGWGAVVTSAERENDGQSTGMTASRPQVVLGPTAKRESHAARVKSTPVVAKKTSIGDTSATTANAEHASESTERPKASKRTLTHAEAMIKFFSELEERNRILCEASRVRGSSGTSSCSSVRTELDADTEQKTKSLTATTLSPDPAAAIDAATDATCAEETISAASIRVSQSAEEGAHTMVSGEDSEVPQSHPEPVVREAPLLAVEHAITTATRLEEQRSKEPSEARSGLVSVLSSESSEVKADVGETGLSGKMANVALEAEKTASVSGKAEASAVVEEDAGEVNVQAREEAPHSVKLDRIVEPARESSSSSSVKVAAVTTASKRVEDGSSAVTYPGSKSNLSYLMDLDDLDNDDDTDASTILNPVEEEKSPYPELNVEEDATDRDSAGSYNRSSEGLVYLAESDDAYKEARMMLESDGTETSPTAAEGEAPIAMEDDEFDGARPELNDELLALADAHVETAVATRGMSRSEAMADFFRSLAEEDKRLHQYRHPVFFQVMSIQLRLRRFSLLPSELTGLPDYRSSYTNSEDSLELQPERVEL